MKKNEDNRGTIQISGNSEEKGGANKKKRYY